MFGDATTASPLAAPTTAERIRSSCARGAGMIAVEGVEPVPTPVHHLLADGSFAITVPADGLLAEMIAAHRDVVDRLADRLPSPLRRGRVRPLGLDRYGVQLRVENESGDHDVRLPFAKPVDDVTRLNQAIRVLLGCRFRNGLRARRI